MDRLYIKKEMERCAASFEKVLYEEDITFMDGMKSKCLAGDDISKYQFWEWTQGVGLFGFWKLYKNTNKEKYLSILTNYYDRQLKTGLPAKNVNTTAPLLALSFLAEHLENHSYRKVCEEWAEWIYREFPRTREGGFQHITSDTLNDQELWDDTLFMTVLFLANMGKILHAECYVEEAKYQFLLHIKYLTDKVTGLWYHGWTFQGNHNFANAFWGRGNCWVTASIPELLDIISCEESVSRFLTEAWKKQIDTLISLQEEDGMWHTLIDDKTSYVEASATCGFSYGILKGINLGLLNKSYLKYALKALPTILSHIDREGILHQVSYGTPMGREDKQFYKDIVLKPMPYGQALAMLYFQEVLVTEKYTDYF